MNRPMTGGRETQQATHDTKAAISGPGCFYGLAAMNPPKAGGEGFSLLGRRYFTATIGKGNQPEHSASCTACDHKQDVAEQVLSREACAG